MFSSNCIEARAQYVTKRTRENSYNRNSRHFINVL